MCGRQVWFICDLVLVCLYAMPCLPRQAWQAGSPCLPAMLFSLYTLSQTCHPICYSALASLFSPGEGLISSAEKNIFSHFDFQNTVACLYPSLRMGGGEQEDIQIFATFCLLFGRLFPFFILHFMPCPCMACCAMPSAITCTYTGCPYYVCAHSILIMPSVLPCSFPALYLMYSCHQPISSSTALYIIFFMYHVYLFWEEGQDGWRENRTELSVWLFTFLCRHDIT